MFQEIKITSSISKKYNFSNYCYYCERQFTKTGMTAATIDHIIPMSRNGNNSLANKLLCCSRCNGLKGSYLPNELISLLITHLKKREGYIGRGVNKIACSYPIGYIHAIIDNLSAVQRRIGYLGEKMIKRNSTIKLLDQYQTEKMQNVEKALSKIDQQYQHAAKQKYLKRMNAMVLEFGDKFIL